MSARHNVACPFPHDELTVNPNTTMVMRSPGWAAHGILTAAGFHNGAPGSMRWHGAPGAVEMQVTRFAYCCVQPCAARIVVTFNVRCDIPDMLLPLVFPVVLRDVFPPAVLVEFPPPVLVDVPAVPVDVPAVP